MGKHDHLKPEVEQLLTEGKTVVEICSVTGIPKGSIHYVLASWRLLDQTVRGTGRFSEKTRRKWSKNLSDVHSSGKTAGKRHRLYGKRRVRGEWVSLEQCSEELKAYVEEDLTLAEMAEAMGVCRRRITTWLQDLGLQQGIRSGARCSWYKGGWRKERGPDWLQVRERILERDGHKCRQCGCTQDEARERGHTLSIHHIVPWEESRDNSDDNLITLCQSCHMQEEWRTGRWSNDH